MDFRGMTAPTWGSVWVRGQPQARRQDGSRVQVQTPTCACRVSVAGAGTYRVDMTLEPDVASHRGFATWISDMEEAAAESEALAAWRQGKSRSATVFRGNLRLMAFSDTMVYDADGRVSADLMSAAGCTALLELQGCWSTEGRWGVRLKVVQLKYTTAPPTLVHDPPEPAESSEEDVTFGFVDV